MRDVALVGDLAPIDVVSRQWYRTATTAPTLEGRIAAFAEGSARLVASAADVYRFKMRGWHLTWGSLGRSRGPVVLVDHAAEHRAALHRRVERHDDRLIAVGWLLMAGLVRPVPVVMPGISPQHGPQVALAVDQHPVRAPSPHGPYPLLRITVRPGRQAEGSSRLSRSRWRRHRRTPP